MDINRRKMQVSLGVLGLLAVMVVGFLKTGSTEHRIHTNPRDFLLTESDLPQDGKYVIPPHERHVITNDLVIFLLGDQAGEKRIQSTGRVVGWRVHFVNRGGSSAVPEEITQTVTQYGSVRGAQLNLETYRLSTFYPESGWHELDFPRYNLGDQSVVETRSVVFSDGNRLVSYSITFTYRNMGVRLEAVGNAGEVNLNDLSSLAKIVLARLDATRTYLGPVPTPTPGFEIPEEDFVIYR